MMSANSSSEDTIPLPWKIFTLAGWIYLIFGIYSLLYLPVEREITHLPAWLRRSIDGIFVIFLGIYAIRNPQKRPWSGWLQNSWLITYALISLLVHYGGMLPPIYIYDHIPWFNKVMHTNACLVITLGSYYGRLGTNQIESSHKTRIIDGLIALSIGIVWEILEYLTTPPEIDYWTVIDVGYGWYDTIGDLVTNVIGIFLAYLFISQKSRFFRSS